MTVDIISRKYYIMADEHRTWIFYKKKIICYIHYFRCMFQTIWNIKHQKDNKRYIVCVRTNYRYEQLLNKGLSNSQYAK